MYYKGKEPPGEENHEGKRTTNGKRTTKGKEQPNEAKTPREKSHQEKIAAKGNEPPRGKIAKPTWRKCVDKAFRKATRNTK